MTTPSAALLAVALLAAACASTEDGAAPPSTAGGAGSGAKSGTGEAGGKDDPLLTGQGKSGLYQRIDSLSGSWQRANAEPGEKAALDARALETAIAREVWGALESVLADLRASANPRWRSTAARGLGFVRDERIRPALEGVLGETDPRLLSSALVSLARGADAATDDRAVVTLLRHPDAVVRGNAALCLARAFQARRQQGMEALAAERAADAEADLSILLFERDDPIVRGNAAQALGALGSPGAEDALLNLLRDDAAFVRLKAAQALALCGTPKALPPLLDALGREGEGNVRTVLALGLGAVAERRGQAPSYADLGTDAGKWRRFLQR